jgi:regulator of cell morphogenesis and NO signaling
MTDAAPTLAELVTANPAAARVLDTFGIDYCCRGHRTLAVACDRAGLDEATIAARLAELGADDDSRWTTLDAPSLAAHIVDTNHCYLHEELPLLDALVDKVPSVHGDRHPELKTVAALVKALRADLEPHLMKEERVLFPAIEALAGGQRDFPFGSITNPIRMMTLEHDRAGDLLAVLRGVTRDYAAPADGCTSYRSLYERLAALEQDTHVHVHKENHVLVPAALRLIELTP